MEQKRVDDILGSLTSTYEQEYLRISNGKGTPLYMPKSNKENWWCTCGAENDIKCMSCTNCGVDIRKLAGILKKEYLQTRVPSKIPTVASTDTKNAIKNTSSTETTIDSHISKSSKIIQEEKKESIKKEQINKDKFIDQEESDDKYIPEFNPLLQTKNGRMSKDRIRILGVACVCLIAIIVGGALFFLPKDTSEDISVVEVSNNTSSESNGMMETKESQYSSKPIDTPTPTPTVDPKTVEKEKEQEIINDFFEKVIDAYDSLNSGNYGNLSGLVDTISPSIKKIDKLNKKKDAEYASFLKVLTSNPFYKSLKNEYIGNKQNRQSMDAGLTSGGWVLIIRTCFEYLLKTELPYDKNIDYIKKEREEEKADNASQINDYIAFLDDCINSGYKIEVDTQTDGKYVSVKMSSEWNSNSGGSLFIRLASAKKERQLRMAVWKYSDDYSRISKITFKAGGCSVKFDGRYTEMVDDYFSMFDTYSTEYKGNMNKRYEKFKELFWASDEVKVYLNGKYEHTYSKKQVKKMRQLFEVFDVLITEYN